MAENDPQTAESGGRERLRLFSPPESQRIPNWVVRAILAFLLGVAGLYYARGVLSSLRPLFIIILVSLFLSFAIEPAVNRLERIGIRRGLGTGIVFLFVVAFIGAFGFAVGTVLAEQVNEFTDNIPQYLEDIDVWLEDNLGIEGALADVRADYDNGELADDLTGFADEFAAFGAAVVNILFQAFTVALFTFYLVAEGPKLRRQVCSLLQPEQQRRVLQIWDLAIEKTGGYILSRAILAGLSALGHWVAFELIGLDAPLPLALWVGIMSQFIPVVGTYIAGVLPVVIGLLSEPATGIWALVVIVIYQQVENYLLQPRVTAHTMEIHVAVAFGAVLAGSAVLGVVGALLALPFAATVQAFISSVVQHHEVEEAAIEESRARRYRPSRRRER